MYKNYREGVKYDDTVSVFSADTEITSELNAG